MLRSGHPWSWCALECHLLARLTELRTRAAQLRGILIRLYKSSLLALPLYVPSDVSAGVLFEDLRLQESLGAVSTGGRAYVTARLVLALNLLRYCISVQHGLRQACSWHWGTGYGTSWDRGQEPACTPRFCSVVPETFSGSISKSDLCVFFEYHWSARSLRRFPSFVVQRMTALALDAHKAAPELAPLFVVLCHGGPPSIDVF